MRRGNQHPWSKKQRIDQLLRTKDNPIKQKMI